jgi:hypothetical protein
MSQRAFSFRTQTSAASDASPEMVFETITDLRAHLVWSGERAADDTFKLLSVDAPRGAAWVGTEFTSTRANFNGTFHDRSTVMAAVRPSLFIIETDAHLDRKRGKPWDVHLEHRYDIEPAGAGSRIVYTETIQRLNYVPY